MDQIIDLIGWMGCCGWGQREEKENDDYESGGVVFLASALVAVGVVVFVGQEKQNNISQNMERGSSILA